MSAFDPKRTFNNYKNNSKAMEQSTKTLFSINAVLYLVYAVGAFFIIPNFERLFDGFEVKLEGLSLLIVETYRFWLIFPVFFIGTLYYFKGKEMTVLNKKVFFYTGVLFVVLGILFVPIISSVMYSVIFNMPVVN